LSAEVLGLLTTGTWRTGRALHAAALVLAEATYAVVAPRRPRGNRGPETERSPVGAAVVSPVSASRCEAMRAACRRSVRTCRERRPERRRRRGAEAPEPDFESGWEGVRAAHGIPLFAVLGANHHREGWWELIFSATPYLARQLSMRNVVPTL
jgi:hypothetical protein